ncbi:hypothetical protein AwPolaro_10750 [Polaromonas sp.]|nr:hypothetical protein AwPolaro_10750 [Polaromonas sp.]
MSFYDNWKPYMSVAQRQAKAAVVISKAQQAGTSLAPVAAYRGAIAKTFWGKAWCDNLENYSDYANRLPRGSTYVRNGSVVDLQITPGQVHAQVMGSDLYTVSASIKPLADKAWKSVCGDCSASIDSLVELLQGKLSNAVMERICKPGSGLFPAPSDINLSCSCPDWATMCKHVAAVFYGIGARLDTQPELLFSLRGVEVKDLIKHAGTDLLPTKKRPASSKVLDTALLADVFGLEMAEEPASLPVPVPAQKPKPKPKRKGVLVAVPVVTPAKKRPVKVAAKSTAKLVVKPVAKSIAKPVSKKVVKSKTKVAPNSRQSLKQDTVPKKGKS